MGVTRRRGTKRLDARRPGGQFQRSTLGNTFGIGAKVCPYCRGCTVLGPRRPEPGFAFAAPGFEDPPATCSHCLRAVKPEDWGKQLEPPIPSLPIGESDQQAIAQLRTKIDQLKRLMRVVANSLEQDTGPSAHEASRATAIEWLRGAGTES